MSSERSPRYAPPGVLDALRFKLRGAAGKGDLNVTDLYEHAARAVEQAYEHGYADGWMRGHQESHEASRADAGRQVT